MPKHPTISKLRIKTLNALGNRKFKEMLKINPGMDVSHPKEDFVVENFIHRCSNEYNRAISEGELDYLVSYFNIKVGYLKI